MKEARYKRPHILCGVYRIGKSIEKKGRLVIARNEGRKNGGWLLMSIVVFVCSYGDKNVVELNSCDECTAV